VITWWAKSQKGCRVCRKTMIAPSRLRYSVQAIAHQKKYGFW
jgi:hypothetical protein